MNYFFNIFFFSLYIIKIDFQFTFKAKIYLIFNYYLLFYYFNFFQYLRILVFKLSSNIIFIFN